MKPDVTLRASLQEATLTYAAQVGVAEGYLKARGIPLDIAMDFKLGVVVEPSLAAHKKYTGRLSIPFLTRAGVVAIRFRCMEYHNCKEVGHAKYLGMRNANVPLYNVEALFNRTDELFITEGELDALVCSSLVGSPAVGCPGSNGWKPHFTRCVGDFRSVVVVGDGDDAGRAMVKALEDELPNARGVVLPEGQDVNSFYLDYGPFELAHYLTVGE